MTERDLARQLAHDWLILRLRRARRDKRRLMLNALLLRSWR